MTTVPLPTHAAASASRPQGPRARAAAVLTLLLPVLVALVVAGLTAGSYADLVRALDPSSALGPCRDGAGVRPLCDFANHYYPQGLALAGAPRVVHGFFYGGFFAVWMRLWASFGFSVARLLWGAVVVGAAALLLFAPLVQGARWSRGRTLGHGVLVASSLPLWLDLVFGQVSALTCALAVLAFVAHGRRRSALAGLLLGLAASIKVYPALFAVYFLLRRDRRALLGFAITVAAASAVLPLLVLGERGFVVFYGSLWQGLRALASFAAATPASNNLANAASHLVGPIVPSSTLYRALVALGMLIAGAHAWLAWVVQGRGKPAGQAALMLGFATLPFVVRPCWVHYFVFLPLVAGYVLDGAAKLPAGWRRRATVASVVLAGCLVSVPAVLLIGPDTYYTSALPFWATVVLLPGLYQTVIGTMRDDATGTQGRGGE